MTAAPGSSEAPQPPSPHTRSSRPAQAGVVYLVGAGPGSVDLLTLRAHALISSATCLLHDDLVSDEILSLAPPGSMVRNVGKRCGVKTITQQDINHWMVEHALAGHSVVRLKSGDPLLFGRAAEEIHALQQARIPFEIIAGVSTAFAAAALAHLPLTGRITSSKVLFATRHLTAGKPSELTTIASDLTLVLYMPGKDYRAIARELQQANWSPLTRCVVASSLGTSSEQLIQCTLDQLAYQQPLPSPAILIFHAPEPAPDLAPDLASDLA